MQLSEIRNLIQGKPNSWLITGCAGFIGSHLLEFLLLAGQSVKGVDNFLTGSRETLLRVQKSVNKTQWKNFELLEGDLRDFDICRQAVKSNQIILHQAAM